MKNLYNRLDKAQKNKYYDCLLTKTANTYSWLASPEKQLPGSSLAELIFEPKVSDKTFTKIKNLVIDLNKPNDIKGTKTECKKLADTLAKNNQITPAQKQELYKAIGI